MEGIWPSTVIIKMKFIFSIFFFLSPVIRGARLPTHTLLLLKSQNCLRACNCFHICSVIDRLDRLAHLKQSLSGRFLLLRTLYVWISEGIWVRIWVLWEAKVPASVSQQRGGRGGEQGASCFSRHLGRRISRARSQRRDGWWPLCSISTLVSGLGMVSHGARSSAVKYL